MEQVDIPSELRSKVVEVGDLVEPSDVDVYRQIREIEDKSHKLRTVIDAWERQQNEDRALRQKYGTIILVAVCVQLGIANVAFFCIGFGWLTVEQWVANVFFAGVFAEVAAMALVVVKYLFPQIGVESLNLIEKL